MGLQSVLPGGGAVRSSGALVGRRLQLLSSSCSSLLSPDSCGVVWYTCENFDKLFLHDFQREEEKSF